MNDEEAPDDGPSDEEVEAATAEFETPSSEIETERAEA